MANFSTKATIGTPIYVISGNAIATVTVNDITWDEKTGIVTNLTTSAPDGTISYPDTAIGLTPQEIAGILVSNWEAANPTASSTAAAADQATAAGAAANTVAQ